MSKRLGPPFSVYSSPLVIYSGPLVICSCCLLNALRTCLSKCFINMTIYLISFSAHFATIFSSELRVLFLDMFFFNLFFVANVWEQVTHTTSYISWELYVTFFFCYSWLVIFMVFLLKSLFFISSLMIYSPFLTKTSSF